MIFQIDNEGTMQVISTDSRILKSADRNKSASFQELLALMFSILENEQLIRNHTKDVIYLVDCVSLQLLHRQKYSYSKLLEFSLFLSTFSNVSINYAPGKALFFADLMSRSYNEVYLENKPMTVSKEWGQILPQLDKMYIGQIISPHQLLDFLASNPVPELMDCFSKSSYYSQNINRYHTLKSFEPSVPAELDFLAQLYVGWNGATLSQEKLAEIDKSIKKNPVEALQKRIKNLN